MIAYTIIMLLIMNSTLNANIDSALESIIEAERVGVDTTELVDRFNKVLFDNCQECTEEIRDALVEIEDEARSLKIKSIEKNNLNTIIAYAVYAPIAAFIASLVGLYIYNKWEVYKTRHKGEK